MKKELQAIDNQVQKIKEKFAEQINALPDNPKINRISTSPCCFTIMSSDLGNNWSPFYHDYKAQYKFLADLVTKTKGESIINILEKIVKKGTYSQVAHPYGPTYTRKFHPAVISKLKEII